MDNEPGARTASYAEAMPASPPAANGHATRVLGDPDAAAETTVVMDFPRSGTPAADKGAAAGPAADKDKDKAKAAEMPMVPFGQLFRFATRRDWLLMLVGAISAVLHGAMQPVFAIVFGEILNDFSAVYNGTDTADNNLQSNVQDSAVYICYVAIAIFFFAYFQVIKKKKKRKKKQ